MAPMNIQASTERHLMQAWEAQVRCQLVRYHLEEQPWDSCFWCQ
jgi:hypothetical protein